MPITNVTTLPPEIIQHLNKMLIDPWASRYENLKAQHEKIFKKYRNNVGILREFQNLFTLLEELNEWYKAEKAYQRSENKETKKKPMLEISEKPLFPYELRDQLAEFIKFVHRS